MAKVPAFAKAFAGRWRIVEMDVWDNDFLDLVEEAHLTLRGTADGEIAFGALRGVLDVRYGARDGAPYAEFSWEGHDENDPACQGQADCTQFGDKNSCNAEATCRWDNKSKSCVPN